MMINFILVQPTYLGRYPILMFLHIPTLMIQRDYGKGYENRGCPPIPSELAPAHIYKLPPTGLPSFLMLDEEIGIPYYVQKYRY